jgi:hypothetical protein
MEQTLRVQGRQFYAAFLQNCKRNLKLVTKLGKVASADNALTAIIRSMLAYNRVPVDDYYLPSLGTSFKPMGCCRAPLRLLLFSVATAHSSPARRDAVTIGEPHAGASCKAARISQRAAQSTWPDENDFRINKERRAQMVFGKG